MARGRKTGGRTKGTPNKATAAKAEEIAASGLTPLDYMLTVMRNPRTDTARRDDMAKAAAPYVHPRLAAIATGGEVNNNIAERLAAALARVDGPQQGDNGDQDRPHRDPPRKRDARKAARKGKRARAR
jgi:hypothetical protein